MIDRKKATDTERQRVRHRDADSKLVDRTQTDVERKT